MRSQSADVRGVPMRWEEAGSGPPVVLVHGIPTSPTLWRRVVPLVDDARCLALEMVGYGRSIPAGRDRDISVSRQADYLLAWLREVGVDRAVLVGHDLGGGVAQIAATREPDACAGLVLVNSIAYDSWPIPSVRLLRAVAPAFARLPAVAVFPVLAALMPRGHETFAAAREAIRMHARPYLDTDGAAGLARQAAALHARDTLAVADRLPQLAVPARVVWGAADQFQKLAYGQRLAEALRAPLHRLEGGKHFVPEDRPQAVAAAIRECLGVASL